MPPPWGRPLECRLCSERPASRGDFCHDDSPVVQRVSGYFGSATDVHARSANLQPQLHPGCQLCQSVPPPLPDISCFRPVATDLLFRITFMGSGLEHSQGVQLGGDALRRWLRDDVCSGDAAPHVLSASNGKYSLLKHPDVRCGGAQHSSMLPGAEERFLEALGFGCLWKLATEVCDWVNPLDLAFLC